MQFMCSGADFGTCNRGVAVEPCIGRPSAIFLCCKDLQASSRAVQGEGFTSVPFPDGMESDGGKEKAHRANRARYARDGKHHAPPPEQKGAPPAQLLIDALELPKLDPAEPVETVLLLHLMYEWQAKTLAPCRPLQAPPICKAALKAGQSVLLLPPSQPLTAF